MHLSQQVFCLYSAFLDPHVFFYLYFQTIILEVLAMNILDVVDVSTIQIKKIVEFIVEKYEW